MSITLRDLEKVVGTLKERKTFKFESLPLNQQFDLFDVFPDVEDSLLESFSPRAEGDAQSFLIWSKSEGTAFKPRSSLASPLAMRWGGDRNCIQLAFAKAGLTTLIDVEESPVEGFQETGTLVIPPASKVMECDLRRLLSAFAQLRREGVTALENPGPTRSAGWESVEEVSRGRDTTAVFWHSQGHEAFDGFGQLSQSLPLHWRGDDTLIVDVLKRAGFTVERPQGEDTTIAIGSPGPCPRPLIDPPAASRAPKPTWPHQAKTAFGAGFVESFRFKATEPVPVVKFAFGTKESGFLVVDLGYRYQEFPHVYQLRTGLSTGTWKSPSASSGPCGGLHFLPDGRLLYTLEGSGGVSLEVWKPGTEGATQTAFYPMSHVALRGLSAIDGQFRFVALATSKGIALRRIGTSEQPIPQAKLTTPGLMVRKKNPPPSTGPGPWDEIGRVEEPPVDSSPMLAMTSDGRYLMWTNGAAICAKMIERESGQILWVTDFFEGDWEGRDTVQLLFSPAGDFFLAVIAKQKVLGQRPDGKFNAVMWHQTLVFRTRDGARTRREFEAKLDGAVCLSFDPTDNKVAAGFADGTVRIHSFPDGNELASASIASRGGVTAVQFNQVGDELALGTARGEVIVLRVEGNRC